MRQDTHSFIQLCAHCQDERRVPDGTIYQIMVEPQWSWYIVEYLQTHNLLLNINLARKRAIEIEARIYTLIGNQ